MNGQLPYTEKKEKTAPAPTHRSTAASSLKTLIQTYPHSYALISSPHRTPQARAVAAPRAVRTVADRPEDGYPLKLLRRAMPHLYNGNLIMYL